MLPWSVGAMSDVQPVSVPALPLSSASSMVEVRHMRLSWSVFASCCLAFGSSPQWRRNKERLARHKLDHRLGGRTEQEVYEHYMSTVKPRATRNDVGKQRKRTKVGAAEEQQRTAAEASSGNEESKAQHALDMAIASTDHTSSAYTSAHTRPSTNLGQLHTTTASATDSLDDQHSWAEPPQLRRTHSTGASTSSAPSSRPPLALAAEASSASLLLEVQRLHRTLDYVNAAMMEEQDRQTERNRLVDMELAELRRALLLSSPASDKSMLASLPGSEAELQAAATTMPTLYGQQVRLDNPTRQVALSLPLDDSVVDQPARQASASSRLPRTFVHSGACDHCGLLSRGAAHSTGRQQCAVGVRVDGASRGAGV